MVEDLARGAILHPSHPEPSAADALIRQRQPNCFSWEDWVRLDKLEVAGGRAVERPRVKFTRVADMLAALNR
jgi:ferredoxin--NADP+ reductase